MDKNAPATKKDLDELESRLKAERKAELKAELNAQLTEMRESITEQIRDSQTEILRGFEKFPIAEN
jgi:hypothetical protein